MSKDYRESRSKIWVYRAKENPKGTPSTSSGVSLALDSGSFLKLKRIVEDDRDEVTGYEGATRLYQAALSADGKLKQTRARPDFCLFTLAYFFGASTSASAGTGAYKHSITPLDDPDHPSFTLCQRYGDSVMKERYAHNVVKGFTLSLGDKWVGIEADVVGSGKRDPNYEYETVTAPENATSLTLAANAVHGSSAAERLESVRFVRVKKVGESKWTTVSVTAASGATPAVLTISAPGTSSTDVDYEVFYHPAEAAYYTPPAALDESPMRLAEAKILVDGHFDGSDVTGGIEIGSDVVSFEITGTNDIAIENAPDGSGELYANRSLRRSREITIKTARRFRDIVRQAQADGNTNISLLLRIRGAEIPGSGVDYGLDIVFPRVGIVDAPIIVKDKILAEEGDLRALVDPDYGIARVFGWNSVVSYM